MTASWYLVSRGGSLRVVHIKLADVLHDHPIILQPIRLVADDIIFLCEIGGDGEGEVRWVPTILNYFP